MKEFKKLFREPSTLFLTILFPMVLTLAFGAAFGSLGTSQEATVYQIAVVENDVSDIWSKSFKEAINRTGILDIKEYEGNISAYNDLLEGIISAVLIMPEGFGNSIQSFITSPSDPKQWINVTIELAVDQGNMIVGAVIPPLIQQALDETLSGGEPISLFLPVEIGVPQHIASRHYTQFDYMVPGIYSYAAIFITMTVAQTFSAEKEQGLIKRLNMTPATSMDVILSQISYNLISGIIQVGMIYLISNFMGFQPKADLIGISISLIIVLLLVLCNVGFGLITASLSNNSGTVTGLSFLFILPQMFLGTFLPVSKDLARFVPSYYVTDALTSLMLRGASSTSQTIIVDLTIVFIVGLLVVIIGIIIYERYGKN